MIALSDGRVRPLWISATRPGRTSEITACRHGQLTQKLREAGLAAIADLASSASTTAAPTPSRW
ncbi:hypothetical protein ACYF6T_39625 [Streptomyces sp. 7R007]